MIDNNFDKILPPNLPIQTGMKVVKIHWKFDYKNKLEDAYGQNIVKGEGVDEEAQGQMVTAMLSVPPTWTPWYYKKVATMVKSVLVAGKFRQCTGFTARGAYHIADIDTMYILEVEFFAAKDKDGVMQPADYWELAWRSRENVPEDGDYIKSKLNKEWVYSGVARLLDIGEYKKTDGKFVRKDIGSCLTEVGVKNPSDAYINEVRKHLKYDDDVVTNIKDVEEYDDVQDELVQTILDNGLDIIYATFTEITNPKYDAEVVLDIINVLHECKGEVSNHLENKTNFTIPLVSKVKSSAKEKLLKIRDKKPQKILDKFNDLCDKVRVVNKLRDEGLIIEDVFKPLSHSQLTSEEKGKLHAKDK